MLCFPYYDTGLKWKIKNLLKLFVKTTEWIKEHYTFGGSNYDSLAGVTMTLLCTHGRVSGPSSLLDLEVMAPRGYSVPCQL